MCEPNNGKPSETLIVNIQIMRDAELVRLVVDVEGRDFQCKVGYWLTEALPFGEWWEGKAQDMGEWLELAGLGEVRACVLACAMRMHTPMREALKGVVPNNKVKPMTFTVSEPTNSEVLRVQDVAPLPPPAKKSKTKKPSAENQDELLL